MPPAFEIGGLLVSTSALAFVVFFWIAPLLAGWLGRRYDLDAPRLSRTAERSILAGVIGARIGFISAHPDVYRRNPFSALYFWQPGYLLWVGILAAIIFAGWSIARMSSPKASALMLGISLVPLFAIYIALTLTYNQFMPGNRLRAGMVAPPLKLVDLSDNTRRLADLRGRPVILNFWATWCYACRQEMPLLNEAYRRWKSNGLAVVGVDLGETAAQIRSFLQDTPVAYDIWKDKFPLPQASPPETGKYFARTGGAGLPTTLFIDREGIIRSLQIGELRAATLARELPAIGVKGMPR